MLSILSLFLSDDEPQSETGTAPAGVTSNPPETKQNIAEVKKDKTIVAPGED